MVNSNDLSCITRLALSVLLCRALAECGPETGGSGGHCGGTDDGDGVQHRVAFTRFVQEHQRTYPPGSEEYKQRLAFFVRSRGEVNAQNVKPDRLWTAAVNKLADRSPTEIESLKGRRGRRASSKERSGPTSLLQLGNVEGSRIHGTSPLPEVASWSHLKAATEIENQGGCGSCWAFAASSVLKSHSEIYRTKRSFSKQEMVSCVQNPKHCGGTGGCQGATSELAFEYVKNHGSSTDEQYPYLGQDSPCKSTQASLDAEAVLLLQPRDNSSSFASEQTGMYSWTKLPENQLNPLKRALVDWGPVAVSIAASDWNLYAKGIHDSCVKDAVIDHAVMLSGYGQENSAKYWVLQNSWGPDWGEAGNIRIMRLEDSEEAAFCGIDSKPDEGNGCDGGPKQVTVCGRCGILYDASVPHFSGPSFLAMMMASRRHMEVN